ncbi:hypothetical protein BD413DRAFT_73699 [Trametes elegans]|nr:hypothetical protein BD413DRAFT_73699 [Trametes elegans]
MRFRGDSTTSITPAYGTLSAHGLGTRDGWRVSHRSLLLRLLQESRLARLTFFRRRSSRISTLSDAAFVSRRLAFDCTREQLRFSSPRTAGYDDEPCTRLVSSTWVFADRDSPFPHGKRARVIRARARRRCPTSASASTLVRAGATVSTCSALSLLTGPERGLVGPTPFARTALCASAPASESASAPTLRW